ncbi:MAG: hypothetical protein HZA17_12170 [Nitrospirae bacterium]|nr:hypothetical protein [Nitrospirota bacterium]
MEIRRSSNLAKIFNGITLSIVLTVLLCLPVVSSAEVTISLKNSFIEQYKNRATIDTTFTVDMAHKKPNAPSKDGDLHVAGRSPEVELPVVAEIMNAKFEKTAVDLVHEVEGTGKSIKLSGAWRLWCEHAGGTDQIQGEGLDPFETSNPDHVFEIHPVSRVGDISVLRSFKSIQGFKTKDAHDAFVKYENTRFRIIPGDTTTSLVTGMVGYNYVEFMMEILDDEQKETEDGRFVMAAVRDLDGELLVRKVRMVFVKDTPPDKAIKNFKKGKRVHVLGIPRIDLALVSWRVEKSKEKPDVLNWSLPYEIIVVGVYK